MQSGLMEQRLMQQQIREILHNTELQQQIKRAIGPNQVIRLVMAAGAKKGYSFTRENIIEVLLQVDRWELNDAERLVASGNPFN